MSVVVSLPVGYSETTLEEATFPAATAYHIDDSGFLHVRDGKGNVASFAYGQWASARIVESPDSVPLLARFRAADALDGEAIHLALLELKRETGRDLGLA